MRMNLDVTIGELILHGLPAAGREEVAAAIQTALARLLAERGLPTMLARRREMPLWQGGPFQLAPGATAGTIGAQVAQAIYAGLGGGEGGDHPAR